MTVDGAVQSFLNQELSEMLDAKEAGLITEKALAGDAEIVKPYLKYIEIKIREAAQQGKRKINHPFCGCGTANRRSGEKSYPPYPHSEVEKAVRKIMESKGYTWTEYPDPDPGSPGSGPYTTVSW